MSSALVVAAMCVSAPGDAPGTTRSRPAVAAAYLNDQEASRWRSETLQGARCWITPIFLGILLSW